MFLLTFQMCENKDVLVSEQEVQRDLDRAWSLSGGLISAEN